MSCFSPVISYRGSATIIVWRNQFLLVKSRLCRTKKVGIEISLESHRCSPGRTERYFSWTSPRVFFRVADSFNNNSAFLSVHYEWPLTSEAQSAAELLSLDKKQNVNTCVCFVLFWAVRQAVWGDEWWVGGIWVVGSSWQCHRHSVDTSIIQTNTDTSLPGCQ